MEAPWGIIGSMGTRVDSEWWWVSEGMEAVERLRDWMTVLENTAESMKSEFLFQKSLNSVCTHLYSNYFP